MSTTPSGPRTNLFSILYYLRDPIGCMVPFAKKYGDPFQLPSSPPVVFTGDPAAIRAIYTADPDHFAPMSQDAAVLLGERSLILASGSAHRRGRRLLNPAFQGARMRAYGTPICSIAEDRSAGWAAGQTISLLDFAQSATLDVILQAVFGVSDPEAMAALAATLLDLTQNLSPLVVMLPWTRREFGGIGPYAGFLRRRERLYAAFDALIAAARATGPRDDILSQLLAAKDEEGAPLSDAEIRDQLLLLVIAGHETTAFSLSWVFYALHRPENAASLERLTAELDALGPDADPETLARQPYLEAVCQETLRRYPLAPAPAPRRLLRPLELLGYTLPEGSGVCVAIGLAHFREETYPDPWTFRPERFLERSFSPFEFVPFGGGTHRCLGASLALHEMKLATATLLRRFRLRLASDKPDGGKVRGANVGPTSGVKMIVEERRGRP